MESIKTKLIHVGCGEILKCDASPGFCREKTTRKGKENLHRLTSLQGPFGDFVAVGAPPRPVVGSHLDLIVGPDDEVLQEQAALVRVGDIFHLAINRQP